MGKPPSYCPPRFHADQSAERMTAVEANLTKPKGVKK